MGDLGLGRSSGISRRSLSCRNLKVGIELSGVSRDSKARPSMRGISWLCTKLEEIECSDKQWLSCYQNLFVLSSLWYCLTSGTRG